MTITIIGAGNIGGTLAEKWKAAGHDILIGARNPNDAETLTWAQGIGARVLSIPEAVDQAEAVLIATPGKVVVDLAASLGNALSGKLVMDATNMAGPLGTAPGFDALKRVGGDVVKVFNCTGWENLADVRYGEQVADMFMAGGSEGAKATVRDLAKAVGFEECPDLGADDKVPILEGFALVWIDLAISRRWDVASPSSCCGAEPCPGTFVANTTMHMDLYQQVFENNRQWVADKLAVDPAYFDKLAQGQHPEFLYIGCSDSRVTAEDLMGLQPGQVFIHRNIANQVVPLDGNVNAVVQYAVEHLRVKHIVICGHYNCGGVKAALEPSDMGQLNNWLQTLRDVYRLHMAELDAITDERARFDRLVELNVLEQCMNVIKLDHVQKRWYKERLPMIHGWVFDVRTGKLKDLGLDMEKEFMAIRKVYDLKPTV